MIGVARELARVHRPYRLAADHLHTSLGTCLGHAPTGTEGRPLMRLTRGGHHSSSRHSPPDQDEPEPGSAIREHHSRALQAAWEARTRAVESAVATWRQSCAALLAAIRRGGPEDIAYHEAVCADRQRDVDLATARAVAARDRFLTAYLHPELSLWGDS